MKYKLPERFKLTRHAGETRFWLSDKLDISKAIMCDSLKEAFEKIESYLAALEKIEKTKLPNGYAIVTNSIDYKFILTNQNGTFVASNSFEQLVQEATKTTELDLQIAALNNGEEIEL